MDDPCSHTVPIDPVCPPPNGLDILHITDTSITLTWNHVNHVDIINGTKIAYYAIECWMDGHEDSPILRTTNNNSVTIEPLVPNNFYFVQVRAVCNDITGSAINGPACHILELRTTRDIKRLAHIIKSTTSKKNVTEISGIGTYSLTLKEHQGTPTPGVGHYIFGELSYSALYGKRRRRTILVLGATGSGKTTWINAMVNYMLDVKWDDNFRFKLIDEPVDISQAHSQTDKVTTYDLYHMKGSRLEYSLTVVDTPGFGDTQGIEKDNEIMDLIQKYFQSRHGVQQLEAVCFVVQASLPRLTTTQKYIFDKILSIFSQDIKDNIQLMVTFADNAEPPVLEAVKKAGIPLTMSPHKFSSSVFFESMKNEANKFYFDMSIESFNRFFDDLSRMKTKSLSLTGEVLDERKRLHVLVEGLQIRIEIKLTRVNELEKIKKFLTENQAKMAANINNFKFNVFVPKLIDIRDTSQFTTNCRKCEMTCHFPCRQDSDGNKNKCSVMSPTGCCRICNCMWTDHFNQTYRYEMVKEKQSLDFIRQLYQGPPGEIMSNDVLLDKIRKDIDEDEKQLLEMMHATSQHIWRLDDIALRPHSFSTAAYIDLMIETEKVNNRPGLQERIARLQKLRDNAKFLQIVVEQEKSLHEPLQRRNTVDQIDLTMMKTELEKIRRRSETGAGPMN